ncbi:13043_t:CDS:2 [Rhizophagus irregularis]|nr:13043_t:CDS:2 [Rhizophagus irregularis]
MSFELVLEYKLDDQFNATLIVTDLEENSRLKLDLIIVFEKTQKSSNKDQVSSTKKRPRCLAEKEHESQKTKVFWIKLVAKPTVLAQYVRYLGLESGNVDISINENNTIKISGDLSTNDHEVTINNDTFPITE